MNRVYQINQVNLINHVNRVHWVHLVYQVNQMNVAGEQNYDGRGGTANSFLWQLAKFDCASDSA